MVTREYNQSRYGNTSPDICIIIIHNDTDKTNRDTKPLFIVQ